MLDSPLVRPLREAEQHFLQVLLSEFTLRRSGLGAELSVSFDEESRAIWLRTMKRQLLEKLDPREITRYQDELEGFLLRSTGDSYRFADKDFEFRYASGGALPVIRLGPLEYYCLFYREERPIGWNIANGGCDSREELLGPLQTIERELREELIVLDSRHSRRYVFKGDAGKPLDHPDFAQAWRLWQAELPHLQLAAFEECEIPMKWLDGPDRLLVSFAGDSLEPLAGLFLNINATDFGIEVDRIGKLNLDEEVSLLDGEIRRGVLLNRPVGLFEVGRLDAALKAGHSAFYPDRIFFNGSQRQPAELQDIAGQYLARLLDLGLRDDLGTWQTADRKYDLCPVTRQILERRSRLASQPPAFEQKRFDLFLSFASEDLALAEEVYGFLERQSNIQIFFSDQPGDLSSFGTAIDTALDSARCLVVVTTSAQHVLKKWVEYEWRTVHNRFLGPGNGRDRRVQLITYVSGVDPVRLPPALRYHHVEHHQHADPDRSLRSLLRRVQRSC